jgi:hypothetical protein
MKSLLPLVLIVAVFFPCTLPGQDLDSKLQSLQKVGEEFAAASAMGTASDSLLAIAGEYREFSNNFSSLQSYVQSGNYDQSVRTLKRWLARTKNKQIQVSLSELLKALEEEQAAKNARKTAELDKLLKEAAAQIAAATTPEQTVDIQNQLEEFRDYELNNGDRANRILSERVNRATNFIKSWREVLSSEAMGEYGSALQALKNLRRNTSSYQLLGADAVAGKYQSLLSAMMKSDASGKNASPVARVIAETMAKVKTPDDAAAALAVLSDLASVTSGIESRMANALQNSLNALVRLNEKFTSGAYARVITDTSSSSHLTTYTPQIEALADDLRLKAVAAANELPDLGLPRKGEGFSSFIRRLAVEAYEKKDWSRLYTLLSVYSSVSGGGCARTGHMQEGVKSYIAAQQLEKAGQFRYAVVHYSNCVAELGKLVPREEAAAALAKLRKDHPEAFDAK